MPQVRKGRSINPYNTYGNRPPFEKGDFVTPIRDVNCYPKFRHGTFKEIIDVVFDSDYSPYGHHLNIRSPGKWVLVIHNETKEKWAKGTDQNSRYNPANFTKESYIMPTQDQCSIHQEASTYVGFRLQDAEPTCLRVTEPDHSLNVVETQIRNMLQEGDIFVIMKTVKRIEALPPRPPVKVTEYR